jgi:hypothetical protein
MLLITTILLASLLTATTSVSSAPVTTGFTSEEELVQLLLGLSDAESPELFLDMDLATTADFLNLSSARSAGGEATLASFLDLGGSAEASAFRSDAITEESIANCDPDSTVFGTLNRQAGTLSPYDFSLTVDALQGVGISSLLDAQPAESEFRAYVLVAPTDNAWVKLKQQLENEEGSDTESLPLQSLLTYSIYGETNQTLFNAVKDVINGTVFALDQSPLTFFLNVPIDMLDGNVTVLSTGSASQETGSGILVPELNGFPILAIEPACNGIVLALDEVLLPGIAVEQYLKSNIPEEYSSSSSSSSASSFGEDRGCTDVPPPAPLGTSWTCQDQKYWGKCNEYWMWESHYCASTCGYCGLSEFPYAQAASSGDANSGEASSQDYYDPCACSQDGLSGDVYTGVSGCSTMTVPQLMGMAYASSVGGASATEIGRQFGSRFDNVAGGSVEFNYCYVVEPSECKSYTEPSPFYEGVRWRFC